MLAIWQGTFAGLKTVATRMSLGIGEKLVHEIPEKYSQTWDAALKRTHTKLSADLSAILDARLNRLCCEIGIQDENRTKRPLPVEFCERPQETPPFVLPTSSGAGNEDEVSPVIVMLDPLFKSVFG